ncbi:MAG: ribonuclease D [Candidatus Rokuibacteriota bacterium]
MTASAPPPGETATPPVWIRTPEELVALSRQLAGAAAVALDTEADSLHHYPERLCLVQVADVRGRVFLVDPLALPDLEPLRPLCADPATVKVFHSAENDLDHLKRRFGFQVASVFDTMLAARFLGLRELGLDVLLERYVGGRPTKSQQKANWARRPLTRAQEEYAAEDVRHLLTLRDRLTAELRALGREAWLLEECEALAAQPAAERPVDENGYRRLSGAARLDPRGLAVLQSLHAQRESWARAERRPPFKVLSPDTLVALARTRPEHPKGLAEIPGLTPRLVERYGEGILGAIRRGLAAPMEGAPRDSRSRPPVVPLAIRRRVEALKHWRTGAATTSGLDPGVLLPQRLINALAAAPPADVATLAEVPGVRRWRAEAFGGAILAALGRA